MKEKEHAYLDQQVDMIIDHAPEPVFILDTEKDRLVRFNRRLVGLLGYSENKLTKSSLLELSPDSVNGKVAGAILNRLMDEALRGGNPQFSWQLEHKSGKIIPCQVRLLRFPPYDQLLVRGSVIDERGPFKMGALHVENTEPPQLISRITRIGSFDWWPLENKSHWDDGMYELFGVTEKTETDKIHLILSKVHPEDKGHVLTVLDRALSSQNINNSFSIEYRIIIKGVIRYIIGHGFVFRNDNGKLVRAIGILQDVTELRQAFDALAESEERFRILSQAAFEGIVISKEGIIFDTNDQSSEIFGYSREEVIGKNVLEFTAPHCRDLVIEKIKKGDDSPFEVDGLKKDGTIITLEVQAKSIPFKGQSVRVTAVKDITENKKALMKLQESKDRLSLIFRNTSDFMALIRVEGGRFLIESLNRSVEEINQALGSLLNVNTLDGMEADYFWQNVLHLEAEEVQNRREQYKRALHSQKPVTFMEQTPIHDDIHYTETCLTPIREDGVVTRILVVSRDVTEQIRSSQKLDEAFTELNEMRARLERENIYLREEIQIEHNFGEMVFGSQEFKQVLNQVERVAPLDATVLISGETGTGKELIARAVHNLSKRAGQSMIKINCGAIPRELVESELFGYEKGAFTGAVRRKAGKIELADGGTLLLDEIGELPLDIQVKLLRVLQEREFERLGATGTIKVNLRLVASTCRDLRQEVVQGNFREDLFFRLNVFPIYVPPLRKRVEDIPLLVKHFVNKYNNKHSKRVQYISDEAMDYFNDYAWPGNVRELENVIERSIILSPGEYLMVPDVDFAGVQQPLSSSTLTLNQVQRNHIRKVLNQTGWKVEGSEGAARLLGMKPSTLRDRMKKLSVSRPG